jgi:hypothetical protein
MPQVISNTSPLLFLHRIDVLHWLPALFEAVWVPQAVMDELQFAQQQGYDVPQTSTYDWLQIVNPSNMPSEWFALDLGKGELAAMALALEHPQKIILLDDALARRVAQAAGLQVWGTLKVLLEAKAARLTDSIEPFVNKLETAGMWLSEDIRLRVLKLAGE